MQSDFALTSLFPPDTKAPEFYFKLRSDFGAVVKRLTSWVWQGMKKHKCCPYDFSLVEINRIKHADRLFSQRRGLTTISYKRSAALSRLSMPKQNGHPFGCPFVLVEISGIEPLTS